MTGAPRYSKKLPKVPAVATSPVEVGNTPPADGRIAAVWHPIKQHKDVQWTIDYMALACTLLHGVEMLVDSLGWSPVLRSLFTLVQIPVLGIAVVTTTAWYHGALRQQRASDTTVMMIARRDRARSPARGRPPVRDANPGVPAFVPGSRCGGKAVLPLRGVFDQATFAVALGSLSSMSTTNSTTRGRRFLRSSDLPLSR
jgi:hypothetical protein